MERYSVHLKLLGMAVLWGASWPMGRMLGQSLPPFDGRGGSVCAGFGFVVGLVVCTQQVCNFGGFVGAAMAGLDYGRFRRRVRLCGVFYAGFADYAGRQGGGGRGGKSRADTAVGNLVFRRAFKCEDFSGVCCWRSAAPLWW